MKLTNASLKRLIEKPGRHGDGDGLYFRTLGLDRAYWVFRYRTGGKEREMSLGPYPELSLIEARAKHAAARKAVVVDKADPLAERRADKAAAAKANAPTFGEWADAWHQAGARLIGGCCRTTPQDIHAIGALRAQSSEKCGSRFSKNARTPSTQS